MNLEYYFISTSIGKLTIVEENGVVVYIGLPKAKLAVIKNWCKQYLDFIDFTEIKNPKELSQSLIEDFKSDIKKNDEIINKINNYGLNILNSVIKDIKKYINI